MCCAKTAEPTEMSFEMYTRVGPVNHALAGGPDPSRGMSNFGRTSSGSL